VGLERTTIFSVGRKYRYTLWRGWSAELRNELKFGTFSTEDPHLDYYPGTPETFVQFIGLNPSTADEKLDDPTIRRCIAFAKAWGFGALCMTNAFAWRDTLPKNMKKAVAPVGRENNDHLLQCGREAGLIIAAWGKDGVFLDRQNFVRKMFFDDGLKLHHLGLNGDGTPRHPLYLKGKTLPTLWNP
jgi:hypothetical protein